MACFETRRTPRRRRYSARKLNLRPGKPARKRKTRQAGFLFMLVHVHVDAACRSAECREDTGSLGANSDARALRAVSFDAAIAAGWDRRINCFNIT